MQGSPRLRAGSSSPTRFNEDDTIVGIFIGPRCDLEKEEADLRRLQHALRDPQQESCAPSIDQSSTPSDIPDQLYSESEDIYIPSSSTCVETDKFVPLLSPLRALRPRKRATLSPRKARRGSQAATRANRTSLPNASTSWTPISETEHSPSTSNATTAVIPMTRRQTRASTAAALASQSIPEDSPATDLSEPLLDPSSGQINTIELEDDRYTTTPSPKRKTRYSPATRGGTHLALLVDDESTTTRPVHSPPGVRPESSSMTHAGETDDGACTPRRPPLEAEAALPNSFVMVDRPASCDSPSESVVAAIGDANIVRSRSPSPRRSPRRHIGSPSPSRYPDHNPPLEESLRSIVQHTHADSNPVAVSNLSYAVFENGFEISGIVSESQNTAEPPATMPTANSSHVGESASEDKDIMLLASTPSPPREIEEQLPEDSAAVLPSSTMAEPLSTLLAGECPITNTDCATSRMSDSVTAIAPSAADGVPSLVATLPPPNIVSEELRKVSDTSTARTVSSSTSTAEVRGILLGRVRQPITPPRVRISPSKPIISPRKNPLLVSVSPKKPLASGNTSRPAPLLHPRFRFNPFLPSTPTRATPAKPPGSIGPPILVSVKKPVQNLARPNSPRRPSPVRPKPIPFTLMRSSPDKARSPSQNLGLGPGIGSVNRKRTREADEIERALVENPRRRPAPQLLSSVPVSDTTPSPSRKRMRDDDEDTDVLEGNPAANTPTPSPNKRARPTPTIPPPSLDYDDDGDGDDTEGLALKLRQMKEDVASWDSESKAGLTQARRPNFLDNLKPSPALDFQKTRPASVIATARFNPGSAASQPTGKGAISSPQRRAISSTLARSKLNSAKPTFPVSTSPVRPTSRPVPVPSPSRPGFGGSRTSSSKSSTLLNSPVRRAGPALSAPPVVHKASSNENIFQTGPVLPPLVQRETSSRVASGTSFSQSQRPTPAAADNVGRTATTTPSVVRSTGIPLPRGLTGVSNRPISRLPRPTTSLSKLPGTTPPIPFTFGTGEAAAFAPMNINVSMAHVTGSDDAVPGCAPPMNDSAPPRGAIDNIARPSSLLSSSEPERLPHGATICSPSALPQDMDSSPATSEASSLDPLGMSPMPKRPRRASRSRPSRLSVSSNADTSNLPVTQSKRKSKSASGEKLPVSELSATALGKLTNNNTKRNEIRVAALDRRFVLLDIPRPPSPSSRIRTVAQKESDEAEMARQRRARNRSIMKGEILPLEEPFGNVLPLKHARAPGDEEDYHTPKKTRLAIEMAGGQGGSSEDRISESVPILGEVEEEDRQRREKGKGKCGQSSDSSDSPTSPPAKRPKFVRWDKLLATAGPSRSRDGSGSENTESSEGRTLRSALSKKAFHELDRHGNLAAAYQPIEGLKRDRVVVTKTIYADDPNEDPEVREARASASRGGTPIPPSSK